MIIKFCGLTNLPDALAAADLGADMLGFNFYPISPRCISTQLCTSMVSEIRQNHPKIRFVGVFVDMESAAIQTILDQCNLDLAQLCGNEPPSALIKLGARGFKAIRPANLDALRSALGIFPRPPAPPALLIDAYRPGEFGGTGQTADWILAANLSRQLPILLAGGLTPENVHQAVQQVHPWGVDVASGIEKSPGIKDFQKMKAFIQAAKIVHQENSHDNNFT